MTKKAAASASAAAAAAAMTMEEEAYATLERWLDTVVPEAQRADLQAVLWPILVHAALAAATADGGGAEAARALLARHGPRHRRLHHAELTALEAAPGPGSRVASSVERYAVGLSVYSRRLLESFLAGGRDTRQPTPVSVLCRLFQQHIIVETTSRPAAAGPTGAGAPAQLTADDERTNRQAVEAGQLDRLQKAHRIAAGALGGGGGGGGGDGDNNDENEDADGGGAEYPHVFVDDRPAAARVPLPASRLPQERPAYRQALRERRAVGYDCLPSVAQYTVLNARDAVVSATVADDCSWVAAACADSVVRLWDMQAVVAAREAAQARDAPASASSSSSLSSPSSSSSSASSSSRDLDAGAAGGAHCLVSHSGPVYKCVFAHEDRTLLTCSQDATVRLWTCLRAPDRGPDADDGTQLPPLVQPWCVYRGHLGPVWDVAAAPYGHYFASAAYDATARLWSVDRPDALRVLAGHTQSVARVVFHPNANYVLTGADDKTVRLWDLGSGQCVRVLAGLTTPVSALAFSGDGRYCFAGGLDGEIVVWSVAMAQGGPYRQFVQAHGAAGPGGGRQSVGGGGVHAHAGGPDHEGSRITSLSCSQAVSGSQGLLASTSMDGRLCLWNVHEARARPLADDGANERHLAQTLYTKSTRLCSAQWTDRNLLLTTGVFVRT